MRLYLTNSWVQWFTPAMMPCRGLRWGGSLFQAILDSNLLNRKKAKDGGTHLSFKLQRAAWTRRVMFQSCTMQDCPPVTRAKRAAGVGQGAALSSSPSTTKTKEEFLYKFGHIWPCLHVYLRMQRIMECITF
jgi:hypothetical protein